MTSDISPGDSQSSGNSAESRSSPEVEIVLQAPERFSFACWQNSLPLVQSLNIRNRSDRLLQDLRLEIAASPECVLPRHWLLQDLQAGQHCRIADGSPTINGHFFSRLTEAQTCTLTARLLSGSVTISEETREIRVLARDEWTGGQSAPETLAAFVTPNDPAIASLLSRAAEILEANGHSNSLEGYQAHDPLRVWLQIAAVWSALAERRLIYVSPPGSFERTGQKIRRAADVLYNRQASCLDLALLLTAACEAIGLNAAIILQNGHCLAAIWLVDCALANLLERDPAEIRKAAEARELLLLETTLLAGSPATLQQARQVAVSALAHAHDDRFYCAVDLRRARQAQIRPLASATDTDEPAAADSAAEPSTPLLFEFQPDEVLLPSIPETAQHTTAEQRLDRWQRRLLDLTLRNQLLNFRPGRQSVPFSCPPLSAIEDRLAAGKRLTLVSLPEHFPRADGTAESSTEISDLRAAGTYMAEAVQQGELAADLSSEELTRRLTRLYRRSRNDLSEGGSNTLFLAIGFLRWRQQTSDQRSFLAPVLLLPVRLIRRNARAPFQLSSHEDEVRVNSTLLQMLRQDFAAALPSLEAELPRDEAGIDVPRLLQRVREDVRALPGFEVMENAALSTFSFARYLMWKDLTDRHEQLRKNRVVQHLTDHPDQSFAGAMEAQLPQPGQLDAAYAPQDLVFPLPADSSQLAAVAAASEGHDFVVIGPPGTGKSQTIANMIAQCLAQNRTVLFVAEKTAALEVVYRRLRQQGLADICVELHSSRTERRGFLQQMYASWSAALSSQTDDWSTQCGRLRISRDQLNRYVQELHRVRESGWSIFEAMGLCVLHAERELPAADWNADSSFTKDHLLQLRQTAQDLGICAPAAQHPRIPEFLTYDRWTPDWEQQLLRQTAVLQTVVRDFSGRIAALAQAADLPELEQLPDAETPSFVTLLTTITSLDSGQLALLLLTDAGETVKQLLDLEKDLQQIQSLAGQLSTAYPIGDLERIPVQQLDAQDRMARSSFWPLSVLRSWQLRRLLQTWTAGGKPHVSQDLPVLLKACPLAARISGSRVLLQTPCHDDWAAQSAALSDWIRMTAAVHSCLLNAPAGVQTVCTEIIRQLADAPDGVLRDHLQRVISSFSDVCEQLQSWQQLTGSRPRQHAQQSLAEHLLDITAQLQQQRTALRDWTAWNAAVARAVQYGLGSFAAAVLEQAVPAETAAEAFDVMWVRWWLQHEIGRNDLLCRFRGFTHQEAIREFARIDEAVRAAAVPHVLSRENRQLPDPGTVARKSELGLLRHQIQLQRPSKSIREVIEAMPQYFTRLAPCLLMSPLSVAQYLPAEHEGFDVVIMDEASQITTWDAIGAIARGKQTIIVGDPRQLPPTNFFGRNTDDEDNEELEYFEQDLESILDEAQAAGLPTIRLSWHYRSRHESLIAFSNRHYYESQLHTFPSAVTTDSAVTLKLVEQGQFDRGRSRTNRTEAEQIVRDCTERMLLMLQEPEEVRLSMAVITFNIQQQALIEDLLDSARRQYSELEWFFDDAREEPFVVKNLENVQGDERDCILFSITYGPDAEGRLSRNFGPLNRQGGHRRLNVAVTRARRELTVYSSFRSDQLSTDGIRHNGVSHLKSFLDYAERGAAALPESPEMEAAAQESSLESAVAAQLRQRGWTLQLGIGVSRFRVSIGVVDPHDQARFLAGIEFDGITYRDAAAARDRDQIREQVLRGLGWRIFRVWSPDWWYNPDGAAAELHRQLTELASSDTAATPAFDNSPPMPPSDHG